MKLSKRKQNTIIYWSAAAVATVLAAILIFNWERMV